MEIQRNVLSYLKVQKNRFMYPKDLVSAIQQIQPQSKIEVTVVRISKRKFKRTFHLARINNQNTSSGINEITENHSDQKSMEIWSPECNEIIYPKIRVFPPRTPKIPKNKFAGCQVEEVIERKEEQFACEREDRMICKHYVPPIVKQIKPKNVNEIPSLSQTLENLETTPEKNQDTPTKEFTSPNTVALLCQSSIFNWHTDKTLPSEIILLDNDMQTTKLEWEKSIEICKKNLLSYLQ